MNQGEDLFAWLREVPPLKPSPHQVSVPTTSVSHELDILEDDIKKLEEVIRAARPESN